MERYCLRMADKLPEEMASKRADILARIKKAQETHPLAGVARSGDVPERVGGHAGTWEETTLKVPRRRRRQMGVILYTNLLTGPLLVLATCVLLWCLV